MRPAGPQGSAAGALFAVNAARLAQEPARGHEPAARLLGCLQEMAAQDTNAVLLLLDGAARIENGRQYPQGGLRFAGDRWRAFYHCHGDEADADPAEHGHIHVFADAGGGQWAHAAALAVDRYGQPLRWFSVHCRETGGGWLEAGRFAALTDLAVDDRQEALAGRWLHAMLCLYQAELLELLVRRDACIRAGEGGDAPAADEQGERELSSCVIELETALVAALPVQSQSPVRVQD